MNHMGARKMGEQHIRSLTQNKTGTYQVSLPIRVIREMGWRERQKLTVTRQGKKLIVQDWNPQT
ncbi:MAG: AbrB/MazE/SpoVT family DNA-binding domain-containing protein [Candidatus Saccharibacteria bacterium]|nr:AbrB/MazE/SpoVT family DNA-binding domain-containing protein [Candidatus Saccharibacteria bacterium]